VSETLRLERVDLSAERLVQSILEAAPAYTLNTEGVASIPTDGRDTLTALPPNCSSEQKHVLVLCRGDLPVGVADIIQGYPDPKTAFLGLMLLREDQQGQGLGARFYRELETRIREEMNCTWVRLAVVDSNPVVPFWEKQGFRLTGDVKSHEGRNLRSQKRVMEKSL
jgi:GNAT superfamily N-acetyltransferase